MANYVVVYDGAVTLLKNDKYNSFDFCVSYAKLAVFQLM